MSIPRDALTFARSLLVNCFSFRLCLKLENGSIIIVKSSISAEKLAKIAGVKVTTLRRTAKELFELLEKDLELRALVSEAA